MFAIKCPNGSPYNEDMVTKLDCVLTLDGKYLTALHLLVQTIIKLNLQVYEQI